MPKNRIIASNIWSSELSKLVANAFLAQRISSINSFTAFCEKIEADITEVARAIDLDGIDGDISYVEDPYEASAACDAIALMTEWDIYSQLDFEKIYTAMVKPAFIFDGRNILDYKNLFKIGFNVFPIGKSPLTHS